jgi:lipoyl(octanoyl) transferase
MPPDAPCNWRLINSGPLSAATNMALDEAIFESVAAGDAPPTLRLYGWAPPAVSLGYFQRVEENVDLAALAAAGFGLVRRATGGRAILHDAEVTYSVCIRSADLGAGDSVLRSYKAISRGLEAGLRMLGVPAAIPPERGPAPAGDAALHAVCFARTAAGDMAVAGRKIVGSAQMRRAGAILQHGSVPLRIDAEANARLLCPTSQTDAAANLRKAVAGVCDVLGREASFDELAEALRRGFEEALRIALIEDRLMPAESARADQLMRTRYGRDEWNLNPGRRERG